MLEALRQHSQDSNRQRRQIIADYWPLLPVAIVIVITASALVGPTRQSTQTASEGLTLHLCTASEQTQLVNVEDYQVEISPKASNGTILIPVTVNVIGPCPDGSTSSGPDLFNDSPK